MTARSRGDDPPNPPAPHGGIVPFVRATGSPFEPVEYRGVTYQIAQANNALIFPGLGLGVTVCRARRVSDSMLAAAAQALADLSEASTPGAPVLPPVTCLRAVSSLAPIHL